MLSRRRFVAGMGVGAVVVTTPRAALGLPNALLVTRGKALSIRPRDEWAVAGPRGAVTEEKNVQCLLVHHTAGTNDYQPASVPGLLRDIYRFHTGPARRWPDVAYNFFVDRFGVVWEGRQGSISGPVRGDATGGNQGFAQLCCFVGDHGETPPTPEALEAMTGLLAMLADRHGIDSSPGAVTGFVSRGSNRWPPGVKVSARTISGHRDMSQTTCPGDAVYTLIKDGTLARRVSAYRQLGFSSPQDVPGTGLPPARGNGSGRVQAENASGRLDDEDGDRSVVLVPAAGGAAVALGAVLVALRRRASR